ncbi:DNA-binding transcriptional activator SdiA [Escherichia coli]|nr:DNA-binding transcriptional activator SdiA [Escherichia coli]
MLLRFQRMEAAEEVYHEIEFQAQQLEYDYYSLCVRHPVPFTRPKVAFYTNYPEAWVSYYQAKNFLAIDPVLNPENFSQGHLMWNDDLFSEAQPLWEAGAHMVYAACHSVFMLPNRALGFLSFSRSSAREIPILSDELQLKMQLLVRESLMALMRLNDEIVMTPEMNFSKREKEI